MTDQGDIDEVFASLVECEKSLDDVIETLAGVGVKVKPEERLIVSRWLDMFSVNSPLPLGYRLGMLKGMLLAGEEQVE